MASWLHVASIPSEMVTTWDGAFMAVYPITYWCVLRREFSGMIHFITINNNPSNPQQRPATHPFPTFITSKIIPNGQ